jgi:hypothetical protein
MLGLFSNKPSTPWRTRARPSASWPRSPAASPGRVEDASAWMESLAGDDGFKLAQRLDLMLRSSTKRRVHRRGASGRDYPALRQRRAPGVATWDLGHGYWQQLFTAYLDCLDSASRGREGWDAIPQLLLLYGRWWCLAAQLNGTSFTMGPSIANSGTLGGIYLAAVEARLAQKPLQLYAGAAETTIEAEYLKVLVFHAASMDKLRPLQIEIAERLIAYFLPFFP